MTHSGAGVNQTTIVEDPRMRAAIYRDRGPAHEVLEVVELPDPEPDRGEVRVRVHASGINPSDVKSRLGKSSGQRGTGDPLPFDHQVPHHDGAGVIDAVGDGVDDGRVGEAVWVYHASFGRPTGTAGEFVCVPAQRAVALPSGVPMVQAAGIGIPYITAHRCLLADGDVAGMTVLVTGGAGAVGNATIQLARFHDARVVTTVSSEEKGEIARRAGAHVAVDYRAEGVSDRLRSVAPEGIDRVVDVSLTVNLPSYLDALNPHAVISAYAEIAGRTGATWPPPMALRVKNLTLRLMRAYGLTDAMLDAATSDITAALRARALRSYPHHAYRLDDIADAHEAVEAGAVGKVVLELA
jgi:NADPH:quinone reductase